MTSHSKATTREEYFQEVRDLLAVVVPQEKVKEMTMNSSVTADLGADSLDLIEVVMDLENFYGCSISEESFARVKTVGDVVDLVQSLHNPDGKGALDSGKEDSEEDSSDES